MTPAHATATAADHLEQAADAFATSHQADDGYTDDTRQILIACWRAEADSLRAHIAQEEARRG